MIYGFRTKWKKQVVLVSKADGSLGCVSTSQLLSPNRFSTCSHSSSPTLQLHPSVSVGPSPPPRPNCRDVDVESTKIQLLSGYPHAPPHAAAYFHPASVTTYSTRHGFPCLTHLGKAFSCSCKPWRSSIV
jgi:hypothetical protein